ncbi:MAG: MerR family transcriptional regulator [Anaerolineae bacterium]|nr:MerR family transcriptional regulator [Anaerolineae bacterium]
MAQYVSAKEAAAELGISLPTLYAYVSRGLIRSESTGDDHRARRYSAEDVQKLKARKDSRQNPERVAEAALHLGTPVMESGITLIADGRLYYRGLDAIELAATETAERVAALIWTGDLDTPITALSTASGLSNTLQGSANEFRTLPAFPLFQIALPLASTQDIAAYDLRPEAVVQTGGRILKVLALLAGGFPIGLKNIAEHLSQRWCKEDEQATACLNAGLILCADHELNASSFAARVVASTNATPYAVVQAGLAALGGHKHGGHTERVAGLLREAGSANGIYTTMVGRLRRGEMIPGFGHFLYPAGDPRGRALLQMVLEAYPNAEAVEMAQAGIEAAEKLIGEAPTIDFALVILARALSLAEDAPLTLFALGRTIGWIGHAIEQYAADRIIRPRARYVGVMPANL